MQIEAKSRLLAAFAYSPQELADWKAGIKKLYSKAVFTVSKLHDVTATVALPGDLGTVKVGKISATTGIAFIMPHAEFAKKSGQAKVGK